MTLKQKILSGVFWQGLERVGSQGISFLISILLARLLMPSEFGVIAIIVVFIGICGTFVDTGFACALIQKKDMTQADCCSVFFINIAAAAFLYGLLFVLAPFIADFYGDPKMTYYIRVLAINLLIASFSVVQAALLNKRMLFNLSCRINWTAVIVSGGISVTMAYTGFGVWALVAQKLIYSFVTAIMQWLLIKWRPQWIFEWDRVKTLFQFGWKMFCSCLLDCIYGNLYSLVIGKLYNLTTLSYYDRGRRNAVFGLSIITSTIGSVLFPAFSKIQDDPEQLRTLMKRGIYATMFLVLPILCALAILAEPLIFLVYGEKWLPSVIYLQLCCIIFIFYPLHTINLQLITACGHSDYFLILEIIKKIQAVLTILVTYRYGVLVMVLGMVCMSPIGFMENAWPARKLAGYPFWRQFFDLIPLFLLAGAASICSFFSLGLFQSLLLRFFCGGCVFSIVYFCGALLFRLYPPEIKEFLSRKSQDGEKQ